LQKNLAQLSRITAELHKTAMSMRLVPMGPLFRRMARLVRDLARQFGKQVVMQTEGDDIELDRRIVEELADPLMHMVRNSLDHGIETPEERVRAGKSPAGTLTLRGRHHAGQVVIEIADDGKGLSREKIIAKGVESGLIASGAQTAQGPLRHPRLPDWATPKHEKASSGRQAALGTKQEPAARHSGLPSVTAGRAGTAAGKSVTCNAVAG
jgi:two-component sensor histidine kinase